jgi:hypothetical protein
LQKGEVLLSDWYQKAVPFELGIGNQRRVRNAALPALSGFRTDNTVPLPFAKRILLSSYWNQNSASNMVRATRDG